MHAWRMYLWSLVALMALVIWMSSCSIVPRPSISLPPELGTAAPAGAGPAEAAVFYRKEIARLKALADNADAEAKRAKLEARQAWLWWTGVASIVLGVAAFALAIAYPVASFLRIGGVAGIGGGVAALLVGEALPYMSLFGLLAALAIAVSLVLNTRVLAHLTQSWKSASEALPAAMRTGLDETSLKRQGALIRPFIDKLLRKKK